LYNCNVIERKILIPHGRLKKVLTQASWVLNLFGVE